MCERSVFLRMTSVEMNSYSLFASTSITPISQNLIYDYSVYSFLLIKSYLLFFLGTKSQL